MKTKILFVDLGVTNQKAPRGNLGMMAVAEYVRRAGYHAEIIQNIFTGLSESKILEISENYDVIAISSVLANRTDTIQIASKIKARKKSVKIAVGGAGPTVTPYCYIGFFDLIVEGPGEKAMLNWLEGNITSLITKGKMASDWIALPYGKNEKVVIKKSCLQGLAPLSYKEQRVINFQTSRGCPFNCTFCVSPIVWEKKVQFGNIRDIAKKINWAAEELGVNCGDCVDLNFNLNHRHAISFCNELIKRGVDKKFAWTAMLNPGIKTKDELLVALKEAGCFKVGMGVEAFTSNDRKALRKPGNGLEKCFSLMKRSQETGLLVRAFLMIATPCQTDSSIKNAKNALYNFPADEISISFAVPNPKTEMYNSFNYLIAEPDADKWNMHHPIFKGKKSGNKWQEIRAEMFKIFYNSSVYFQRKIAVIANSPEFRTGYKQFETKLRKAGWV